MSQWKQSAALKPLVIGAALVAVLIFEIAQFPIFVDEAVHIWWVQRILSNSEWLRPMNVGKPLEAWFPVPFVALGADPLSAMRMLHVAAGALVVLITYWLGRQMLTPRISFLSAALVAVSPFVVFFARMALAEIYLCLGYAITLLGVALFWRTQSWRNAALLGGGLLFSAFAKFPVGFVATIALPLAVMCMTESERLLLFQRHAVHKLIWAYLPTIGLLLIVVFVAIVRIRSGESPGFGLWLVEGQTHACDRWSQVTTNLGLLMDVLVGWYSLPVVFLAISGILLAVTCRQARLRWIALTACIPLIALMILATEWSSRYLVFVIPSLILAACGGWSALVSRVPSGMSWVRPLGIVIAGFALVVLSYLTALLLVAPLEFPWPQHEKAEYVSDWPSGFGFAAAADFVEQQAIPFPIFALQVGTAKQFETYIAPSQRQRVEQLQLQDGRPLSLAEQCDVMAGYPGGWLISTHPIELGESCHPALFDKVKEFARPFNGVPVVLYRIR